MVICSSTHFCIRQKRWDDRWGGTGPQECEISSLFKMVEVLGCAMNIDKDLCYNFLDKGLCTYIHIYICIYIIFVFIIQWFLFLNRSFIYFHYSVISIDSFIHVCIYLFVQIMFFLGSFLLIHVITCLCVNIYLKVYVFAVVYHSSICNFTKFLCIVHPTVYTEKICCNFASGNHSTTHIFRTSMAPPPEKSQSFSIN